MQREDAPSPASASGTPHYVNAASTRALFDYFLVVNAAEGGIEGLFADIDSPGKFVRYLLRFVGTHERIEPVRDLLKDTAAEIAKRPLYLAEQDSATMPNNK